MKENLLQWGSNGNSNLTSIVMIDIDNGFDSKNLPLDIYIKQYNHPQLNLNQTDFDDYKFDDVVSYKLFDEWESKFLRVNVLAYSGYEDYVLIFNKQGKPSMKNYDIKIVMNYKPDDNYPGAKRSFAIVPASSLGFHGRRSLDIGLSPKEGKL